MKKTKSTVIVPALDSRQTIRDCIKSLLAQDYPDYEIILVDNGSRDGTREIILDYAEKNKKITLIDESRPGRGAARKSAEQKAAGDIILMTDADCTVPEDWITQMTLPLLEDKADAVQGSEKEAENNFWSGHRQKRRQLNMEGPVAQPIFKFDSKNLAITKKALDEIGYTDPDMISGNDAELSVRFTQKGKRLWHADCPVTHHHPDTLAKTWWAHSRRGEWFYRLYKKHEDYIKAKSHETLTVMTWTNFLKILPGLALNLLLKGPGYAFYDMVTGFAWRKGTIDGWLAQMQAKNPLNIIESHRQSKNPIWIPPLLAKDLAWEATVRTRQYMKSRKDPVEHLEKISVGEIRPKPGEIQAYARVKNESGKIPGFLKHHRRLGVERFFIIDDASTDETLEILGKEDDVHAYRLKKPIGKNTDHTDKHMLMRKYAKGRWILNLDIDEKLVYPGCETQCLKQLAQKLEGEGATGMGCLMIDLYPEKINGKTETLYFDTTGYYQKKKSYTEKPRKKYYGGPRKRLFNTEVCLTKIPLIKYDGRQYWVMAQHEVRNVKLSRMQGAILHELINKEFQEKAKKEKHNLKRYGKSREYREYEQREDALKQKLTCEKSEAYSGPTRLAELGLMKNNDKKK